MDEDQDFEAFLREWAKERIWPTHDVLLQGLMAEARCKARGHHGGRHLA
jgi:hypothetical protein